MSTPSKIVMLFSAVGLAAGVVLWLLQAAITAPYFSGSAVLIMVLCVSFYVALSLSRKCTPLPHLRFLRGLLVYGLSWMVIEMMGMSVADAFDDHARAMFAMARLIACLAVPLALWSMTGSFHVRLAAMAFVLPLSAELAPYLPHSVDTVIGVLTPGAILTVAWAWVAPSAAEVADPLRHTAASPPEG